MKIYNTCSKVDFCDVIFGQLFFCSCSITGSFCSVSHLSSCLSDVLPRQSLLRWPMFRPFIQWYPAEPSFLVGKKKNLGKLGPWNIQCKTYQDYRDKVVYSLLAQTKDPETYNELWITVSSSFDGMQNFSGCVLLSGGKKIRTLDLFGRLK